MCNSSNRNCTEQKDVNDNKEFVQPRETQQVQLRISWKRVEFGDESKWMEFSSSKLMEFSNESYTIKIGSKLMEFSNESYTIKIGSKLMEFSDESYTIKID